jgi:hypothetical protein
MSEPQDIPIFRREYGPGQHPLAAFSPVAYAALGEKMALAMHYATPSVPCDDTDNPCPGIDNCYRANPALLRLMAQAALEVVYPP